MSELSDRIFVFGNSKIRPRALNISLSRDPT